MIEGDKKKKVFIKKRKIREKGICESLSSTRPHVVKQGSLLS
jgi:hypothetical protein